MPPASGSKNFYEVLGVTKDASEKDIKQAYRGLARKYHPDVNPGDKSAENRFKEISEAWEVLGDKEKRKRYDSLSTQGYAFTGGAPGGSGFSYTPGGTQFDFEVGQGADIGDILGGIFGGGGRRGPARGDDLQYQIEISLDEAYRGGQRTLTITTPGPCATCHGSGAAPGSQMNSCTQCKGSGRSRGFAGLSLRNETCDRCQGRGEVPGKACTACGGRGIVETPRRVTVTIPPGIAEGQKLRVAGHGSPGSSGGASGDLFLTVKIKPHRLFQRKGDNLHLELPVTFVEAALGGEIQVPTMNTPVRMTLAAGAQSGQSIKLKGLGMPRRGGGHGDLYVQPKIVVPKNLSDRERELIAELAKLRGDNPREQILSGR